MPRSRFDAFKPLSWAAAVALTLLVHPVIARDYQIDPIADGLAWPWSLSFLPDGRMLVAQRGGALRMIENGVLLAETVDGVPPVYANSQGRIRSSSATAGSTCPTPTARRTPTRPGFPAHD